MIVMFISMNTGNNQCHRVKSEKFALKPKAKKKKKKNHMEIKVLHPFHTTSRVFPLFFQ